MSTILADNLPEPQHQAGQEVMEEGKECQHLGFALLQQCLMHVRRKKRTDTASNSARGQIIMQS